MHVAWPPGGSRFVLLPRASRRAARAGLALWEAVEPKQRLALRIGAGVTTAGLHRFLPPAMRTEVDLPWWSRWIRQVVEPTVGPISHIAFRVPGNPRVSALAMDEAGKPVAFGKIVAAEQPATAAAASHLFACEPLRTFRVPMTLVQGQLEDRWYRLFEPLPEGPHRPPPIDPERLWAIIDELRGRLIDLPRPVGTADRYVPCHADLTPRNLRVASDGSWWLFDWDLVRWGPRLADELRYWSAAFAYRWHPNVTRDAQRVVELLRRRGTDEDIREAVAWPNQVRQTYRPIEPCLHAAIGELVNG